MSIKENLLAIKQNIAAIAENVTIVAVSKFHDSNAILEAIAAGQCVFGENRVQEALNKWPGIKKQYPDTKLHLIGALQTNKAAEAVRLFDIIESVDRQKLADCLIKEMHKQNRILPCLIQVNIGNEPQKSGVLPEDTDALINYCKDKGLNITGLMCIPPEGQNPSPYFQKMVDLARKHHFKTLSMGMSGDYAIAIKFGATHVRIGTAIFGTRESQNK